jgi:hypothetical protein
MSWWSWVLTIGILAVAYFMGVLRPTGLWSRSRAQEERDRQNETAQKWLEKDDKQKPPG